MRSIARIWFFYLLTVSSAWSQDAPVESCEMFWSWFSENQAAYHSFDPEDIGSRENLFDELSRRLGQVHQDLTFEFSPVFEDGTREFVLSAGGIVSAFPAVEALWGASPELPKWKILKFRQRRDSLMLIKFDNTQVDPIDVHYCLFRDGAKIGVMLFHKDYSEQTAEDFSVVLYLMLDSVLGEYDVETKVGFIEFHGIENEYFMPDLTLPDMASHFDEVFGKNVGN